MTTNSLNNECLNDFTVKGASGSTRKLRIENTNNTGSSNAISEVSVEGTSAGDPFIRHVVGSSHSYALGPDNDDSDKWKLTYSADASATPSSASTILKTTTGGIWNRPMTPLFSAYIGTNITGVGEQIVVYNSEHFDQGSNYDTANGRFTCPVTGTYLFTAYVTHSGVTASNVNGAIYIYHSASTYYQFASYFDPHDCRDTADYIAFHGVCVYYAAANDYFYVKVRNDSGETTTLLADQNIFSGYLLG